MRPFVLTSAKACWSFVALLSFAIACGGADKKEIVEPAPIPQDAADTDGAQLGPEKPSDAIRPAGEPLTEEEARNTVDKIAKLFDELATAVSTAGSDCNRLAVAVDSWGTTNKRAVNLLSNDMLRISNDVGQNLLKGFQERLQVARLTIEGSFMQCKDNQAVKKALAKIGDM